MYATVFRLVLSAAPGFVCLQAASSPTTTPIRSTPLYVCRDLGVSDPYTMFVYNGVPGGARIDVVRREGTLESFVASENTEYGGLTYTVIFHATDRLLKIRFRGYGRLPAATEPLEGAHESGGVSEPVACFYLGHHSR